MRDRRRLIEVLDSVNPNATGSFVAEISKSIACDLGNRTPLDVEFIEHAICNFKALSPHIAELWDEAIEIDKMTDLLPRGEPE